MKKLIATTIITLLAVVGNANAAWSNQNIKDDMSNKEVKISVSKSSTKLNMKFPYAGDQYPELVVRSHPRYGKDVIFAVDKGQINCSYSNCSILVKFDDGKEAAFAASKPEDGSSNMVFIEQKSMFINKLKKSKKVQIEVSFFKNGTHVFEFNTEGLEKNF